MQVGRSCELRAPFCDSFETLRTRMSTTTVPCFLTIGVTILNIEINI